MNSLNLNPKVSVVIPVYNGSNYLREAIESALGQTYENIEVIVVNDGSNDGGKTEEIAKSYGNRIRYFYKENGGVASALNLGIRNMEGEYFSWLSHDDVYYPNKIEDQIRYLYGLEKDDIIIYSDLELIDNRSKFLRQVKLPKIESKRLISALLLQRFIHGCTLLIPKKYFEGENPFNENLKTTQDYDLWFRLMIDYEFVHLDKVLVKSRQHSEQGIRTLRKSHTRECNKLFVPLMQKLEKQEPECFLGESKRRYFVRLSYSLLKARLFHSMLVSFLISIRCVNLRGINRITNRLIESFKGMPEWK